MSNEQTYQGWSNYETWCVALWLGNDVSTYEIINEQAHKIKKQYPNDIHKQAIELAKYIQELVEESVPDLGVNLYADLLTYVVGKIDYYEITRNILEE